MPFSIRPIRSVPVQYPATSPPGRIFILPPLYFRAVAQAQELRTSAEAGDASAQYRLGLRYSAGNGTPQDSLHAKERVEKAAMQGHAGAQLHLGTLYLEGNGAPQSAQMALVWFSRAAEQEDSLAFAKIGGMYAQGRGVLRTLSRPTCGTTSEQHMEIGKQPRLVMRSPHR